MTRKQRLAILYTGQIAGLAILIMTRKDVTLADEFGRIQAHLLLGVFLLVVAAALAFRDIYPRRAERRWKVWQWAHPLTLLMFMALLVTGLYQIALYLGFSLRWMPPDHVYGALRRVGWITGFLGSPVAIDIAAEAGVERFTARRPMDRLEES